MKDLQFVSIQGSALLNEDVLVLNHPDQIFGVIDGATSVSGYRNEKGETGGLLAARQLASFFEEVPASAALSELVMDANRSLRKVMSEAGVNLQERENLWCAAFMLIRIHKYRIEYVQAGDCMLFARYADGTLRTITHCQVGHLDALTYKKREEGIKLGFTNPDDLRKYILPTIRHNRSKANTLEGYGVLNGDPAFDSFLEFGSFNRAGLVRIYLITDGLFFPSAQPAGVQDWSKTIAQIEKLGIQKYAESLVNLEKSDPMCQEYLRNKVSDDKTGIVIDF